MNNDIKKVLLFSTRKIQEEGIFKSLAKCNTYSNSLKIYFQIGKNSKSVPDSNINIQYNAWKKRIRKHRDSFKPDDLAKIQAMIQHGNPQNILSSVISMHLNPDDDFIKEGKELLDKFENYEKNSSVQREILDLTQKYEDNIEEIGKTIGDRISLYGFQNQDGEYAVYAVWSLKISCNDDAWVDALSKAVIEQCPNCEEIILWLHDNDLMSTQHSVFHVIYYMEDVVINGKSIKRSLGVFQHPDPEFTDILFPQSDIEINEKSIFLYVSTLFGKINMMAKCNKLNILANMYDKLSNKEDD